MGYKMKGMSFLQGQSPMKKVNAGGRKTIAGEDTDIIRKDKKGRDYALSMYNNASGIMKGDTLFAPEYKIPSVYGYVRGGESYDAIETKDSKKRKKGPKSYTLKTQSAPTKLKKKIKKKKSQDFEPAYPGADISKAEYDKARKAGVKSEAEYAEYKAKMKKKKKSPTKLKKKDKKDKKSLPPNKSKGVPKPPLEKWPSMQAVGWKKGKAYTTDGGVKGHYVTDPKGKKYFMTGSGKLHTGQIDDLSPEMPAPTKYEGEGFMQPPYKDTVKGTRPYAKRQGYHGYKNFKSILKK